MTLSTIKMTAKQFLMIGEDPPGVRMELAHGEVAVSPSPVPEHQNVVGKLYTLLDAHVTRNKLGRVLLDVDTRLDRYNVRRPDIVYLSRDRLHLVGRRSVKGPPDLCVEVVSPRSRKIDRRDKFELYRKRGVDFYWLLDAKRRSAEAFRLEEDGYVSAGAGSGSDTVRFPPFDEMEIELSTLWWDAGE